jgi:hypothetical protein
MIHGFNTELPHVELFLALFHLEFMFGLALTLLGIFHTIIMPIFTFFHTYKVLIVLLFFSSFFTINVISSFHPFLQLGFADCHIVLNLFMSFVNVSLCLSTEIDPFVVLHDDELIYS